MQDNKCQTCPIRVNCDWLSEMCRLKANEVLLLRPDLISKRVVRVQQINRASHKWRAANHGKHVTATRNWRQANKDKVNAQQRDYRAKKKLVCSR